MKPQRCTYCKSTDDYNTWDVISIDNHLKVFHTICWIKAKQDARFMMRFTIQGRFLLLIFAMEAFLLKLCYLIYRLYRVWCYIILLIIIPLLVTGVFIHPASTSTSTSTSNMPTPYDETFPAVLAYHPVLSLLVVSIIFMFILSPMVGLFLYIQWIEKNGPRIYTHIQKYFHRQPNIYELTTIESNHPNK